MKILREALENASMEFKRATDAMRKLQKTQYAKPKSNFHN